jgi:signal transduction histidine kinase
MRRVQGRDLLHGRTRWPLEHSHIVVRILATCFIVFIVALGNTGASTAEPRRVLLLYPYDKTFPGSVAAGDAARERLNERSSVHVEVYSFFLDLARFHTETQEQITANYLAQRYKTTSFNLLMVLDDESLRFAIKYRDLIARHVPIVFCCVRSTTLSAMGRPNDVTGLTSDFNMSRTLELAERLQPNAHSLVMISGVSVIDQRWLESFRKQLAPLERVFTTTYLVGLPLETLLAKVAHLSRNTIILFGTDFEDSSGREYVPAEVAGAIAKVANAPVYSPSDSYLGRGIVGGYMDSFKSAGVGLADVALKVLDGESPSAIAPREDGGDSFRVDARQLSRWEISEKVLPPGAQVYFEGRTLWETHPRLIIGTTSIVALLSALVVGLLFERRGRLNAEAETRQRLSELARMNRAATAGELSASIAHEINQPLGAILHHAESAEIILDSVEPDMQEIREIFADIRRDDKRASEVIRRLRALLKKSPVEVQDIDLNETIREVLAFVAVQAKELNVTLESALAPSTLCISADRIQLQQVILNLIINSMDAIAERADGQRKIVSRSRRTANGLAEFSISDSGPGIQANKLRYLFEPFFTTKAQGMGMGLSVARAIIDAHGGRIWAENQAAGGAAFHVTLPLAKVQAW